MYLWQLWHYCIIFRIDKKNHKTKFRRPKFCESLLNIQEYLFVETKISEIINYLTEMCRSCQCTIVHSISEDYLSCFGFHIEVWRFIIWYKQFCTIPAKNSEFEPISSCFGLRKFPPLCVIMATIHYEGLAIKMCKFSMFIPPHNTCLGLNRSSSSL